MQKGRNENIKGSKMQKNIVIIIAINKTKIQIVSFRQHIFEHLFSLFSSLESLIFLASSSFSRFFFICKHKERTQNINKITITIIITTRPDQKIGQAYLFK
jgi:hypothetical protein